MTSILASEIVPGQKVELPAPLPTGDTMYHRVEVLQTLQGTALTSVVKGLSESANFMVVLVGQDLSDQVRHVSLLPKDTSLTLLSE